jgi:hypothetical protein
MLVCAFALDARPFRMPLELLGIYRVHLGLVRTKLAIFLGAESVPLRPDLRTVTFFSFTYFFR